MTVALNPLSRVAAPTLASRSYSKQSKSAPPKADEELSATKRWLAALDNKTEIVPRSDTKIKDSKSSVP